MREITDIGELKSIQLDILSYIDKLCKEHHLQYTMSDGTLLGAVRHKGYIPWDDDIDIWMPRKDYEQLERIMNSCNTRYRLVNFHNTPGYILGFGKVMDTHTILEEESIVKIPMGVYVDIFPFDGLPGNTKEEHKKHVKLCLNLLGQRMRAFLTYEQLKEVYKQPGSIKLFLTWAIRRLIGGKNILRLNEFLSKKYPVEGSSYVGCLVAPYKETDMMPIEIFDEIIELDFEDRKFKAPKGYHIYLSTEYGDYMKLPPKELQVTHHHFKAWWKDDIN